MEFKPGDIVEHEDGSIYILKEVSVAGASIDTILETRHPTKWVYSHGLKVIGHMEDENGN
jgi:hypothetical protein